MNGKRRVVVTGMGALTPIGNNLTDYWQALLTGKSGAGPITKFNAEGFKTRFACEIKGLNLADHFTEKFIRRHDLLSLYALIAAREAIANAGLDEWDLDKNRCGVIWGSGNGGITTLEHELLDYATNKNLPRFSPFLVPKSLADTPSGAIALENGFRGINYCTVSACASATSAIIEAFKYIKWGEADMFVCGGSEAPITQALVGGFSSMKALSQHPFPENASRPLDIHRDGFVIGEGSGALVLESLDHALDRGALILAEVVGGAMSNDAYHATATHPEGAGAVLAIGNALREAGITMQNLDYINLHATSTPVGDLSEIRALKKLGKDNMEVYVSATKSMTGHLLGAAGAIEAIASILSLVHQMVPPTINTTEVEPEVASGMAMVLDTPEAAQLNFAMSNTFGFGGHNAIIIFKRWV